MGTGEQIKSRPSKVLVVDDSREDRACTIAALVAAGVPRANVLEATDGLEGLDQIAANREIRTVLTDVGMPRMNGLDFLEKLRAQAPGAQAWLLTREGTEPFLPQALELGVRGAIPFCPQQGAMTASLVEWMKATHA